MENADTCCLLQQSQVDLIHFLYFFPLLFLRDDFHENEIFISWEFICFCCSEGKKQCLKFKQAQWVELECCSEFPTRIHSFLWSTWNSSCLLTSCCWDEGLLVLFSCGRVILENSHSSSCAYNQGKLALPLFLSFCFALNPNRVVTYI